VAAPMQRTCGCRPMRAAILSVTIELVCVFVFEGNRKALVEKSGLVKHAAGTSTKAKEAQSRQALSAEQQQRNTLHRSACLSLCLSVRLYY